MPDWFKPALTRSLKAGYTRNDALQDLSAGLLVGVVALPLSMGLAIASGVKPEYGLYTAVIGGLIVSLMGGSRYQIAGPAGAFVGLCASGVNQFGYDGLALATMMAGVFMLIIGCARLGRAITFIPVPVVIGFTTGIAVIIASTQAAPALGIHEGDKPLGHFHERIAYIASHARDIDLRSPAICAATMAIILAFRRWWPKAPGALVAIVIVGSASYVLAPGVETILSRFQGISGSIPLPRLPFAYLREADDWSEVIDRIRALSPLALAIALLGSIESLLSAVVADGLSGDRHDSNTELVAQGTANIASSCFLGLPVTGVIARTSTNIRAGARTPVAGIVHAFTVLLIMVAAAPLVVHLPLACLAGILLTVCWFMAELRHWPHILKAGRGDAFLLPLAFVLTVGLDLTWAVVIGVLLSMFFFVKRMSDVTQIARQKDDGMSTATRIKGVEVYEVNGPFFFGAATLIRDLEAMSSEKTRVMILRLARVPFIDATAAFAVRELVSSCRKRGTTLMLCGVHAGPIRDLERHGLLELVGETNVHGDLDSAFAAARALTAPTAA
jgi:sulfate permease, SulP family